MIDIYEVEINMCDFHGTIQCDHMKKKYELYCEKVRNITEKNIEYVRLGYEFCENGLLHTNHDHLLENMRWIHDQGLKIVFVIPPLHQRYVELYQGFLQKLLHNKLVDEFVVNDLGTICLLREKLAWSGMITFGRLFDKALREIRLDLVEEWHKEKYLEEIFSPSVMSFYYKKQASIWNIQSLETDTLPNGSLDIEEWRSHYKIHIHYPRIFLSRSAYCEYAQNECTFKIGCKGQCLKYGKKIVHEDKKMIYKEGLLIYGVQAKPLNEVVHGNIRLIYSEGL